MSKLRHPSPVADDALIQLRVRSRVETCRARRSGNKPFRVRWGQSRKADIPNGSKEPNFSVGVVGGAVPAMTGRHMQQSFSVAQIIGLRA